MSADLRVQSFKVHGPDLVICGDMWTPPNRRGTILLIHGGGQTRHSWGAGSLRLASLGWEVAAIDLRGHGDSGWAPSGEYDVPDHVSDVQSVARYLDGPLIVVGASLGGITALALAAESPEMVTALVLVDIVPRPDSTGVQRIRDFMTAHLAGFASLDDVAAAVSAYTGRPRPRNDEGLRKNVRLHEDGLWYWHWDPALMRPNAREEPRPGLRAEEILASAREVRVPVALVRGGRSDVVDNAGADELVEAIPQAVVIVVPDAGHMVAGDNNDAFVHAIERFLNTIPQLTDRPSAAES